MKLSNLLKKEAPELNESINPDAEARQKTKTIDIPPLSDKPKVDKARLSKILQEDEAAEAKRLEELKMQVDSGTYSPDSKKTALSIIDYLKSAKSRKKAES